MKKNTFLAVFILGLSFTSFAEKPLTILNESAITKGRTLNTFVNFSNANTTSNQYSFDQLNATLALSRRSNGMEKAGKIMTFAGLPLIIIGAILVSNADSYSYTNVNGQAEGDLGGAMGVVSLVAGIGVTGTGIVLWTIGKNR